MARESRRTRDERRFGRPERLADLVATTEWTPPPWIKTADEGHRGEWRKLRDSLVRDIPRAVTIDASNVCHYAFNQGFRQAWGINDFPSQVPPFDACFLEMSSPRQTQDLGSWTGLLPGRFGWFLEAYHAKDFPDSVPGLIGEMPTRPEDVRWIISLVLVVSMDGGGVCGPLFHEQMLIGPDGRILKGGRSSAPVSCCVSEEDSEKMQEALEFYGCLAVPAHLSISFLNCRNVSLSTVDPDPRLNRERKKHGLRPFVRYHTINIEPMKQVLCTEGGIEQNGLKKALHIVRGHFATYTEDRPLFGRSVGTFWKPAHVRGSLEHGAVVSDYRVHAPAPKEGD